MTKCANSHNTRRRHEQLHGALSRAQPGRVGRRSSSPVCQQRLVQQRVGLLQGWPACPSPHRGGRRCAAPKSERSRPGTCRPSRKRARTLHHRRLQDSSIPQQPVSPPACMHAPATSTERQSRMPACVTVAWCVGRCWSHFMCWKTQTGNAVVMQLHLCCWRSRPHWGCAPTGRTDSWRCTPPGL